MASAPNDLSQILLPLADTIVPQTLSTGVTNGVGVKVSTGGTDRINARLSTGAAVGLTSLDVKMQASPDNSTWVDITDQGTTQAFTTVTAGSTTPQVIAFQLPRSLTTTSSQYIYVRAVATVVGTSILAEVGLLYASKFGGYGVGYQNTPQAGF